jgi:hypothetical protein
LLYPGVAPTVIAIDMVTGITTVAWLTGILIAREQRRAPTRLGGKFNDLLITTTRAGIIITASIRRTVA